MVYFPCTGNIPRYFHRIVYTKILGGNYSMNNQMAGTHMPFGGHSHDNGMMLLLILMLMGPNMFGDNMLMMILFFMMFSGGKF